MKSSNIHRNSVLVMEATPTTQPRSIERETLMKNIQEISQKLTLTEKRLEVISEEDDMIYSPGPAKLTFVVKARYRFTGRMEPLPYSLDDE